LSKNNLTSLPEEIGLLKNLKYIDLGKNKLKTLPKSIIKLNKTLKINVNGNPNITIPYILKNKIVDNRGSYKLNYSNYYKNQLIGVSVKRPNLPSLPSNIKNVITKKISNVKPETKLPSKTKNPVRKLVSKIKHGLKIKRNAKNMEKTENRIINTIKTPNTPKNINNKKLNSPKTLRKKVVENIDPHDMFEPRSRRRVRVPGNSSSK